MTDKEQNRALIKGFDPIEIYKSGIPPMPGEVELIVGATANQVIGRLTAFMLLCARTTEGKLPFTDVVIVAPQESIWDKSDTDIINYIFKGVEDLRLTPPDANEIDIIQNTVSIFRCRSLNSTEVINFIRDSTPKGLVIVTHASKYRDDTVSVAIPIGLTGVAVAEDQWVPHIVSLAEKSINAAKETESILIFQVSDNAPVRDINKQKLIDVEGLYPVFLGIEGEEYSSDFIVKNSEKWAAMAASGSLNDVVKEPFCIRISCRHTFGYSQNTLYYKAAHTMANQYYLAT